ncbi:MAG: putative amidohydrolase [Verrucomicrobia bacterium]|jgi:predicted amidohydrolase|nr:MAG: putative amidohydrolase [Verrucomicrobiota bacterium]
MRATLFQLDLAWENPAANLDRIAAMCDENPPRPGDLIVLPELATTAFSVATARALAEPENGPSVQRLQNLARHWDTHFMAGLALLDDHGTPRNTSVLIGPNGIEARYNKLQPFSPPGENEAYPAGDCIVLAPFAGHQISPFVCYDLRFPEIFRQAASAGAVLFTVIASWPEMRTEHWRLLLKARAIENQAFVIGVNRVGTDPFFRYPGCSAIIDPMGQVVCELDDREGTATAEIRLEEAVEWRERFPALRDRRHESPRITIHPAPGENKA